MGDRSRRANRSAVHREGAASGPAPRCIREPFDPFRALAAVAAIVFALVGCAPSMPTPGTGPATAYESFDDGRDASAGVAVGFEPVQAPDLASLLPPELLEGEHHRVLTAIPYDAFVYRYTVASDFGEFEAVGLGLLRQRVHEINVLAALRDAGVIGPKVYALAVANAAEAPLEGASQWILNPVKTSKRIPRGAWAFARQVIEMKERDRTYLEDAYAEELIGFGKAKREWAYRLGIDAYTANPVLQRTLNRYGWLSFAGGMTVRAPLIAVPGGASIALTVSNTAEDMKRELRDLAPEDIRISSRKRLRAMDLSDPVIVEFLGHPWYSPLRQLSIVDALAAMEDADNRHEFIGLAMAADEPDETFVFARLAVMLAAYQDAVAPISALAVKNGLVSAYTGDGVAIVPLYMDHGNWTGAMAEFADLLDASLADDREVRQKLILLSGRLSSRARSEYEARGWTLMEGLEMGWLAAHDERVFAPGKPDPDRVLPEIGG